MKKSEINILNNDSLVRAYPLVANKAGEGRIYLGSKETNSYVIVADYWRLLVDILKKPKRVDEIAKILRVKYPHSFSSRVGVFRVKIMILEMARNGLIESIGGMEFGHQKTGSANPPPKILKVIFSQPMIGIYIAMVGWAILGPIVNPDLRISYQDFFWDRRLSYSLGTYFFLSWLLGLWHEWAHFLVARFFRIKSRLSVSNRWFYLVLQTEHPNIHALERTNKMAVFGAGMVADMLVISLINTLSAWGIRSGLLRQVLLIEWLGVLWQFLFFMRTDIYFVVREVFGIENLYTKTKRYIKEMFMGREKNIIFSSKKEKSTIATYGLFMLLGAVVAVFRYIFYHIPILVTAAFDVYNGVRWGLAGAGRERVVDGIMILVVEIVMVVVFAWVMARKRRGDS